MSNYAFQVKSIYSLSTSFEREEFIDFEDEAIENGMEITIKYSDKTEDGLIKVTLEIKITQSSGEKSLVEGKAVFNGIFEVEGEVPENILESFSRINAPAIIFPYVREYFTNASSRAGIPAIFIQPVNFIEHDKEVRTKGIRSELSE